MTDATWLALTVVLTVVGAALTVLAWRRRGSALAMRTAGITLLVPAAYLTDTLPLLVRIGQEIGAWATRLVLSPVVWAGVGLAGVGVLLFLAGGSMMSRGRGITPRASSPEQVDGGAGPGGRSLPPSGRPGKQSRTQPPAARGGQAADDGVGDDIEAILRRRGIE